MDDALKDELNVDPWTPYNGPSTLGFLPEGKYRAGKGQRVSKCPDCNGPLLAAVTRESNVTIGVCEKCRRRWDPTVLAERNA